MKYTQGKYQVIENKALAKDIFSIVILCPEVAEVAVPGQFVHILPEGQTLRRPISICGIDRKNGTLRIVFIVKGVGTKKISQIREGSLIDMLAPLGHGFTINENFKKVVLIGGGIGNPPMLPLAEIYGERASVQYPPRLTDPGVFHGQRDRMDAEGAGGPSGYALYHGVSSGVHAGGAAVFGAGPCPQELSGGAAADAVGQCDSGSIGPSAGGQAGAGAPERHCA